MTPAALLSLSWQIQVALAGGYAAYILAYTGIRDHHRTLDTTFGTLVFSVVASAAFSLTSPYLLPLFAGAAAIVAAGSAGLAWRRWGRNLLRGVLRGPDVSWSDDDPSAWASLTSDTRNYVSQISVLTDDGDWLRCADTQPFADAPFGPCRLGPTGDVLLYLTDRVSPDGDIKPQIGVRDAHYGDLITYVPAARIRRVTVRHIPRSSR